MEYRELEYALDGMSAVPCFSEGRRIPWDSLYKSRVQKIQKRLRTAENYYMIRIDLITDNTIHTEKR